MLSVSLGTVIWTSIAFLIVVFILAKFAWKPILHSIKEREDSIQEALEYAEKAKEMMRELKEDNEKLLQQARLERDELLKSARDTKDKIISDSKEKASEEGEKIIKSAKEAINAEKAAAMAELKNHVAALSIEIAEKILRQELSKDAKQQELIDDAIKNAKLN